MKKKCFGKGCLVSKFQRNFAEWYNSFVSFITRNGRSSFGLRMRSSCEVHSYPLPQQALLETFAVSLTSADYSTWCPNIDLECEVNDTFASISQQAASVFPKRRLLEESLISPEIWVGLLLLLIGWTKSPGLSVPVFPWVFFPPAWLMKADPCDYSHVICWVGEAPVLFSIVCQPFFFLRFEFLLFLDLHCT